MEYSIAAGGRGKINWDFFEKQWIGNYSFNIDFQTFLLKFLYCNSEYFHEVTLGSTRYQLHFEGIYTGEQLPCNQSNAIFRVTLHSSGFSSAIKTGIVRGKYECNILVTYISD